MKPFKDTYVMYWLLEFIDESSIIALCRASNKLNEICKNYIKLEDDERFEIILNDYIKSPWNIKWKYSELLKKYCKNNDIIKIRKMIKMDLYWTHGLRGACSGGHIDIVKFMIEKGADHWTSGLWRACESGHIDIVKFLIEKGAIECWNCNKPMEEHLKK